MLPVIYKNTRIKNNFRLYNERPELIIKAVIIKRVEKLSITEAACVRDKKSLNLKQPIAPIKAVMPPSMSNIFESILI